MGPHPPNPDFPFQNSPEFLRLIRGQDEPDLVRLCLEFAADAYPGLDRRAYAARIDSLAVRIRDRCPEGAKLRHILGQIQWVLFVEERFRGNHEEYGDPRNSYLNEVLDRKLGIPISLSTLYLAVSERIGLEMWGVNLPGHFVVGCGPRESPIYVDPYHEGIILDRDGCIRRVTQVLGRPPRLDRSAFDPCPTWLMAARMLRNLKAAYLRENDFAQGLPIMRRLAWLLRDQPEERRDLGIACLKTDRAGEAIAHLSAYLKTANDEPDREDIEALLRAAIDRVARSN